MEISIEEQENHILKKLFPFFVMIIIKEVNFSENIVNLNKLFKI